MSRGGSSRPSKDTLKVLDRYVPGALVKNDFAARKTNHEVRELRRQIDLVKREDKW